MQMSSITSLKEKGTTSDFSLMVLESSQSAYLHFRSPIPDSVVDRIKANDLVKGSYSYEKYTLHICWPNSFCWDRDIKSIVIPIIEEWLGPQTIEEPTPVIVVKIEPVVDVKPESFWDRFFTRWW